MEIDFRFWGGHATKRLAWRENLDRLSTKERDWILTLVEWSGVLEAAVDTVHTVDGVELLDGQAPDTFRYELSIKHEDIRRSFRFDDVFLPERVYPLLQFLRNRAIYLEKLYA